MNKKILKNLIIFAVVPTVLVAGYWGYKFYRKKVSTPTKAQLDAIILAFSKEVSDVFTGITPKIYDIALANFMKVDEKTGEQMISRQEADEIIALGAKKQADLTPDEKVKLLQFFPKVLGASSVNAMGLTPVQ